MLYCEFCVCISCVIQSQNRTSVSGNLSFGCTIYCSAHIGESHISFLISIILYGCSSLTLLTFTLCCSFWIASVQILLIMFYRKFCCCISCIIQFQDCTSISGNLSTGYIIYCSTHISKSIITLLIGIILDSRTGFTLLAFTLCCNFRITSIQFLLIMLYRKSCICISCIIQLQNGTFISSDCSFSHIIYCSAHIGKSGKSQLIIIIFYNFTGFSCFMNCSCRYNRIITIQAL